MSHVKVFFSTALLIFAACGSDGGNDAGVFDSGTNADAEALDTGAETDAGFSDAQSFPDASEDRFGNTFGRRRDRRRRRRRSLAAHRNVRAGSSSFKCAKAASRFRKGARKETPSFKSNRRFRGVTPVRTPSATGLAEPRSYDFALSNGVNLTVWFANTNLDQDDSPPNDVDDTDRVLWVAISGAYQGKDSQNIGLSSTKTQVTTAYGGRAEIGRDQRKLAGDFRELLRARDFRSL